MFNAELNPPKYLQMEIDKVCNFKCKMCYIWKNINNPSDFYELSIIDNDLRKKIMRDFHDFNPEGEFNPCGGELFYNEDRILDLLFYAKDINLTSSIVSNGYFINEKLAKAIIDSNIKSISISLDSHDEKIHDYIRGKKGAYINALNAIKNLIYFRGIKQTPYINIASIISKQNIHNLDSLIKLGKNLKIDSVMFNLLIEFFSGNEFISKDVFFEKNFFHTSEDKEKAKQYIKSIHDKYNNDNFVYGINNTDIHWINNYIDDPNFITSKPVCGSHEKNLIVDRFGNSYLCWSSRAALNMIGNLRNSTVKELWISETASNHRLIMDKCKKNCGANNCHRKDYLLI